MIDELTIHFRNSATICTDVKLIGLHSLSVPFTSVVSQGDPSVRDVIEVI
jgi:hypothetical protein